MPGLLNRSLVSMAHRPCRVLQFGTTPRLLSTVDFMIQIANDECGANVGIAVVTDRANDPLVKQDGRYTVTFAGKNPYPNEPKTRIVSAVERFYDANDNYAEFVHAAENPELRWILSDAGKEGIVLPEERAEDEPLSFPEQLLAFLKHRYDTFGKDPAYAMRIVPFEDIDNNAERLRIFMVRIARDRGMDDEFIDWLSNTNHYYGTKVFTEAHYANREEIRELENRRGYSDRSYLISDYDYLVIVEGIKPSSGIMSHPLMHVETAEPAGKIAGIPRIDLHADTLTTCTKDGNRDLLNTKGQVDLKRLKESGAFLQDFAVCLTEEFDKDMDKVYAEFLRIRAILTENELRYSNMFSVVKDRKSLQRNFASKKLSVLLSLEDGALIDGKPERLEELYNAGVRLITLTWNYENCMGFPHSKDPYMMNRGLKPFGIETVKRMNELGMIVDVSHLNDGGFWDVIRYSKKPVVASHSNARGLRNVTRNLTDDMILAIASTGGIVGINFCPSFVSEDEEHTYVEGLVKHIEYIRNLAGIDCVALGSDYDGIPGEIEMRDCTEFHKLEDALRRHGFTGEDIEKIWYKNAMRVLNKTLP